MSSFAFTASVASAGARPAAAPPYTDPAAAGGITLFDQAGNVLTHGSVSDHPLAWDAVGTQAATGAYAGTGRKATLSAMSAVQGLTPSLWSGGLLTASTKYSDPSKPAAQGTPADFSLADVLLTHPAKWNGLVELRLLLSAPETTPQLTSYAATDIQVSGSTWTLVRTDAAGGATGTPLTRATAGKAATDRVGVVATTPEIPMARTQPAAEGSRGAKGSASARAASGSTLASSAASAPGRREASSDLAADSSSGGRESKNLDVPGAIGALLVLFVGLGVIVDRRSRTLARSDEIRISQRSAR